MGEPQEEPEVVFDIGLQLMGPEMAPQAVLHTDVRPRQLQGQLPRMME